MPTDKSGAIRVEGLADFQRELKALDTKLPRQLSQANKRAAEMVAGKTRSVMEGQGGVAAKAAPSIKAMAEQRRSKIVIDGAKYPFALGAQFGGQGRPSTMQFRPWKPGGHALFPTIESTRAEFMALYWDELGDVFRQAFPSGSAL